MRSLRNTITVLALAALGSSAVAQNAIVSWGDGIPGTDFEIVDAAGLIKFYNANGNVYKFYAVGPSGDPNSGIIDNIIIDPNSTLTGDFTLIIGYPLDPNDPNSAVDPNKPGAKDWNTGDLTYPGGTSTLKGIHLAGNLVWGTQSDDHVICDVIDGDIIVNSISATGSGDPRIRKLIANSIVGDITVINMRGDIETNSLLGDITAGNLTSITPTQGDILIHNDYGGTIHSIDKRGYGGAIHIEGDFTGTFLVDDDLSGNIEIDGNLEVGDASAPGRLIIWENVDRINGGEPPNVHIHGSVTGAATGGPAIWVNGEHHGGGLRGTIAIDGSLHNVISNGPEMIIDAIQVDDRGAVAVDYDGWDPNDDWHTDARILVGDPNDPNGRVVYGENNLGAGLFEISPCKGDLNNNYKLDADDVTALGWALLYLDPNSINYDDEFVDDYPGREGSIDYHGDLNCDGEVDSFDLAALQFFVGDGDVDCCMSDPNCGQFAICRADLDRGGDVDLADLATLLAAYDSIYDPNDPNDPNSNYDPDADIDADYEVGLSDLSALLAVYGEECDCFPPPPPGGAGAGAGGESTDAAEVSWVSQNTFSTSAGDYIFDLNAQLTDSGDAWTSSGVALTAHNGTAFRLAWSPITRNAAATFVCSPGALTAVSPASVEIAGSHSPADAIEVFETDEINIVWYDRDASTTGSGVIMRLVIDADSVTDGESAVDVSGVYFSQTGPTRQGDILIVNVALETGTLLGGANAGALSGAFYARE